MGGYAWATRHFLTVLLVPWSDTWVHLALIRQALEHGWFAGDPFYAGSPTPPFYSLSHLLFASVCALTGRPPHEVLIAAPPLLAIVTLAATFAWLRALTGDPRAAVTGTAIVLLVNAPGPNWPAMPYPRAIALTPFALTLLCYLRARQTGRSGYLSAAGVLLGVCIATHLVVGAFCVLALLMLELSSAPTPWRPSPRILIPLAIGAVAAAPWLVNLASQSLQRGTLAPHMYGIIRGDWSLSLGSLTLRMYRAGAIFNALPHLLWIPVALGLISAVQRWRVGHASIADRYALSATLGTLVILLTPLYGVLFYISTDWTCRLVQVIPYDLLAGLGVVGVLDLLRTVALSDRVRRILAGAVCIGALALIWDVAAPIYTEVAAAEAISDDLKANGPLGDWNIERTVAETGTRPSVVFSDILTSYLLPYALGCSVVAIPAAHGSPLVDHPTRERDVHRVFLDRTKTSALLAILDAYHVDTIAITLHPSDMFDTWPTADQASALLRRLRRLPMFSDTGCCSNELVLLRYRSLHAPPDDSH